MSFTLETCLFQIVEPQPVCGECSPYVFPCLFTYGPNWRGLGEGEDGNARCSLFIFPWLFANGPNRRGGGKERTPKSVFPIFRATKGDIKTRSDDLMTRGVF